MSAKDKSEQMKKTKSQLIYDYEEKLTSREDRIAELTGEIASLKDDKDKKYSTIIDARTDEIRELIDKNAFLNQHNKYLINILLTHVDSDTLRSLLSLTDQYESLQKKHSAIADDYRRVQKAYFAVIEQAKKKDVGEG